MTWKINQIKVPSYTLQPKMMIMEKLKMKLQAADWFSIFIIQLALMLPLVCCDDNMGE